RSWDERVLRRQATPVRRNPLTNSRIVRTISYFFREPISFGPVVLHRSRELEQLKLPPASLKTVPRKAAPHGSGASFGGCLRENAGPSREEAPRRQRASYARPLAHALGGLNSPPGRTGAQELCGSSTSGPPGDSR